MSFSFSTAVRRSHEADLPPLSTSQPRLRRSKSTEFFRTVRRKVSLKTIRHGFGRADDSEHSPLQPDTPNISHASFQPQPKKRGLKIRMLRRRSSETPPMPLRLPLETDEPPLVLDTDFRDMEGIVNPEMLYNPRSAASSPSSMPATPASLSRA